MAKSCPFVGGWSCSLGTLHTVDEYCMNLVIPHPVGGVQGACGTFKTGAEMDLYEHQARELFEEHGIVVPRAEVTDSPKEAREIARRLGGKVVVKAQVKTGGRGKAGGVKLA